MAKVPFDFEDEIIEIALNSWIQQFKICNEAVASLMRILSKELPYLEMKRQIEVNDIQCVIADNNDYNDDDEQDVLSLYSVDEVSQPDFVDKDFLEAESSSKSYLKNDDSTIPSKRIKLIESYYDADTDTEIVDNIVVDDYNEENNKHIDNFEIRELKEDENTVKDEPQKQLIIVNDANAEEDIEIILPCQNIDSFDQINHLCRKYEETKSLIEQMCLDQIDKNVEIYVQKCLSVIISDVVASQIDCEQLDIKKVEIIQIIKVCVNKTFPLVNQKDLRDLVIFWLKSYQTPTNLILWPVSINSKKVVDIEIIVDRLSVVIDKDIRSIQNDLKVPCINMYDLYELEIECHKNDTHIRNLVKLFLNVKEETLSSFVRTCLNLILTKKCATKFCWMSVKNRTDKIGVSNFLLIQIILACAQKRFCRTKDLQIKYFLKRYFQSAHKYYWYYIKRLNTTNTDVININLCNENNNKQSYYVESDSDEFEDSLSLIKLPLECINDNHRLEKLLKTSKNSRDSFRQILQNQHTNDLSQYLGQVLAILVSDEMSINYYFNKAYRPAEKININQMYFIKIIKQCTLLTFSHSTVEEIDFIIRRWFNTTKERFYSLNKNISIDISAESETESTNLGDEDCTPTNEQDIFGKRKRIIYFKDPNNEFSFPLNCIEDVEMFDEKLTIDKNLEENLKIFFLTKVEKYPAQYANMCMYSIVTLNIVQKLNWSGKNNKIAASNLKFINMITECAEKIFENRYSSRDIHILMIRCFSKANLKNN